MAPRDPWKTPTIKPLVKRLRAAGFEIDERARDGLVEVLTHGNGARASGLLSLQELLETLLEAGASHDEYAFHVAAAAGPIQTACLVVRADYQRWIVGATQCKSTKATPTGCTAWKIPAWTDDDEKKKRLAAWASRFDASKLGVNFKQPIVAAKRTPDDRARERELLREIVASPTDDNPRLVYADWLADRDPPRSEFIVLQCEAAALKKGARRNELEKRASELRVGHVHAWGFEWCNSVVYRRGFVAAVSVTIEQLVEHRDVFEIAPIEHLAINLGSADEAAQLVAIPGVGTITTLELGYLDVDATTGIMRALCEHSRVFDRVTTLIFDDAHLDRTAVALLSRPTTLPALTKLRGRTFSDGKVLKTIANARGVPLSWV